MIKHIVPVVALLATTVVRGQHIEHWASCYGAMQDTVAPDGFVQCGGLTDQLSWDNPYGGCGQGPWDSPVSYSEDHSGDERICYRMQFTAQEMPAGQSMAGRVAEAVGQPILGSWAFGLVEIGYTGRDLMLVVSDDELRFRGTDFFVELPLSDTQHTFRVQKLHEETTVVRALVDGVEVMRVPYADLAEAEDDRLAVAAETSVSEAAEFLLWEYSYRLDDGWLPGETPEDIDGDGVVDVNDFLDLLNGWGECPEAPAPCPGDLDADLTVEVPDMLSLLENWGAP